VVVIRGRIVPAADAVDDVYLGRIASIANKLRPKFAADLFRELKAAQIQIDKGDVIKVTYELEYGVSDVADGSPGGVEPLPPGDDLREIGFSHMRLCFLVNGKWVCTGNMLR
jgi:hypothetical protein